MTLITVLGSINEDVTATTERLPAAGETVGGGRLTRQPGGKGANQAVAAARLSGASRMLGAIGDDEAGRRMLASMRSAGVDTAAVATAAAASGTALIVVDSAGENQIAVCPGANSLIDLSEIDLAATDTILAQLEISLEVVLDAARRSTGYFALNAAPARELPAELIDRCDLVIVNEGEFAAIPDLATARRVAVTYGSGGAAILERGVRVAFAPAEKTDVVNTVGAGDAFCAALVLALRGGLDDDHALRVACAVGAAAVRDPASQPALESLEHYAEATRAR
jgi:ribokinase